MTDVKQIIKQLRRIPHLKLDLEIDAQRMREEYENCPDMLSYESLYPLSKEHYRKTWSGLSLVGTSDKWDDGLKELLPYEIKLLRDKNGNVNFYDTELMSTCPYAANLVNTFQGKQKGRARFMGIEPNKALYFHSHAVNQKQPEHLLIIQMPIIMPDDFKYVVRKENPKTSDMIANVSYAPGNEENEFAEHYDVGNCYVFNNYHPHTVVNGSDEKRITLMFYASLIENEYLQNLVSDSIKNYTGPFID